MAGVEKRITLARSNAFFPPVFTVLVGCAAHVWSYEQSFTETIVCGGELREQPSITGRRHINRRTLRVITRAFHAGTELSDQMLNYYVSSMNVLVYEITQSDTICAGALVPEVVSNVGDDDMTTELARDYQKLTEVLSALKFVQSHTNDLFQASEIDRLENIVYDVLCSINNFGLGAGLSLPRRLRVLNTPMPAEVFTSGGTAICDMSSVYQRTNIDHEIIRLTKSFFDHLFNKYIGFNRSR